jgi:hypothetical protein
MTPLTFTPRALEAEYSIKDTGNATTLAIDKQYGVVRLISAGAETRTVANPTKVGISFALNGVTIAGTITITFSSAYNTAGNTTISCTAAGQMAVFESVESASGTYVWRLVKNDGMSGVTSAVTGNETVSGTLAVTGVTTPTGGLAASGGFTAFPRCVHTGNEPAIATTSGTNSATNTTNTIYLAECFVPCNMSVTGIAIFNGTAVAGNGKVILYNSAGVKVAQSASTAMSGTTAYQLIPLTGGPIAITGPATYYIGATYDTNTHDLRGHVIGTFGTGTYSTSVVYATDSTLTPVTVPTSFTADIGPIASLY